MSISPTVSGTTTAQPKQADLPATAHADLPAEFGLTGPEAARIRSLIDREPNPLEWSMFGAMWSEHCAYKHSKKLLRTLPTTGARVALGPGENAGAVDLGDGLLCVFKVESHNHPSAVEPFQGAATGVGGILRDVFAMGARPVAVLDALFFGDPATARTRGYVRGVVGGVGSYGNCVGISHPGGHVTFESCYDDNPLVNAMCVGIVERAALRRSDTAKPGSAVYLVGSDTGRDGIAGASLLASFEFGDQDDTKRPSVQVGSPFLEKLLLEATLELIAADCVEAVQDLGAAGLTCAVSEVAAKSRAGMRIDVALVPRRATGMAPFEVMLSESQERMLVVARPGQEHAVERIFARWELHGTRIGEMTADETLEIRDGERLVASLPPRALADEAPEYDVTQWAAPPDGAGRAKEPLLSGGDVASVGRPSLGRPIHAEDIPAVGPLPREGSPSLDLAAAQMQRIFAPDLAAAPQKIGHALLELLASPAVASRAVLYRTYDQMVGTDTVDGPGGDAAVLRLKGRTDGIAISLDAQPRIAALDPFVGAASAVCEAARNLVCAGAEPLAITDCLNLGNPEKPEGAYQLVRTIAGIKAACDALDLPVVSGNVSLYNATRGVDIWPTATIGAVGHLRDVAQRIPVTTGRDGDLVLLAGSADVRLGASAYAAQQGVHRGPVAIDLALEARLQRFVLAAHGRGCIRAAHDRAEGGLAIALAELALRDGRGMKVTLPSARGAGTLAKLFGEGPGGIVLVVAPDREADLRACATEHGVELWTLGAIGGDILEIAPVLATPIDALRQAHESGLAASLGRKA